MKNNFGRNITWIHVIGLCFKYIFIYTFLSKSAWINLNIIMHVQVLGNLKI